MPPSARRPADEGVGSTGILDAGWTHARQVRNRARHESASLYRLCPEGRCEPGLSEMVSAGVAILRGFGISRGWWDRSRRAGIPNDCHTPKTMGMRGKGVRLDFLANAGPQR